VVITASSRAAGVQRWLLASSPGRGQRLGPPALQCPDADPDLARDHLDGRALRRQQPRDDAVPEC
jgi:hypothetical protein